MREIRRTRFGQSVAALVALALVLSVVGPIGTVAAAPGVDVTQEANSTTVAPGETVEFTTTINVDELDTAGAGLAVELPDGWTLVSQTSEEATFKSEANEWLWFVPGGISGDKTVTYTVQAPDDAEDGETVTVTAEGVVTDDGETLTTAVETQITVEEPEPDPGPATFEVSDLDVPSPVTQGDGATVTATVENAGGEEATQTVAISVDGTQVDSTEVTLAGGANEQVEFDVDTSGLSVGSHTVEVATDDDSANADMTVELPPVDGFENPPTDVDGDGAFEDVNGDGTFDIVDVQALFAHFQGDSVQNHEERFDFNDDGEVDVVDVQALFVELTDGN
jgi:predicted secreted protein